MSNTMIVNAIYSCDDEVLSITILNSLINCIPTVAEIKKVKEFKPTNNKVL